MHLSATGAPRLARAGVSSLRGGRYDEAGLFPTVLEHVDNITDTALSAFREHYGDEAISKDAIFDYVYGVLHAPDYRERFANDLAKALPRIPFAPDFHAFADAGRALTDLHLGYEDCEEYPLDVVFDREGEPRPEHFRIGRRAMRFADDEKTADEILDRIGRFAQRTLAVHGG